MAKVSLLIDQGNTRLKWVWARGGKINKKSAGRGNVDDFGHVDHPSRPDTVLISSVAGRKNAKALVNICKSCWDIKPRMLKSSREQGGVRNAYTEPKALGVDRWLAIVGAVACHGKPVVIWDLGTATTLDAVDETGQHLGGMILPGPATMLASLRRGTKLGVPQSLNVAFAAPGSSTTDGIRNGVFAAQLGALNQFLRHVSDRIGGEPGIVVTGGAAAGMIQLLEFDCLHDPWLVFRGMLAK